MVPGIRVRVVHKRYKDGRYYNTKGRVEDVISRTTFMMTMENDGLMIDDVKERYVETALPKAGGRVMVLSGEHKGERGKLLERNSKKNKAVVQLEEDLNIVNLTYDDVSEYLGRR